jgi:mono/diheme cytochrome c family protein
MALTDTFSQARIFERAIATGALMFRISRPAAATFAMAITLSLSACGSGSVERSETGHMSRGEYLVENVGMCGDCHTPRNAQGELDRTRWLQGTKLDFQPGHPTPNWTGDAPGLAGLPRIGDAAVIRLLETGLRPDGKPTRPPMPQMRLSHVDAAAVADYLKSLPPGQKD